MSGQGSPMLTNNESTSLLTTTPAGLHIKCQLPIVTVNQSALPVQQQQQQQQQMLSQMQHQIIINSPSPDSSPRSPRLTAIRRPSPLSPEAMRHMHSLMLRPDLAGTVGNDPSKLSPISPNYATSDLGSSPRSSISAGATSQHSAWNAFREQKKSSSDFTDIDSDCKDLLSPGLMLSPAPFSPFAEELCSTYGSNVSSATVRQSSRSSSPASNTPRFRFSFDNNGSMPSISASGGSPFLLSPRDVRSHSPSVESSSCLSRERSSSDSEAMRTGLYDHESCSSDHSAHASDSQPVDESSCGGDMEPRAIKKRFLHRFLHSQDTDIPFSLTDTRSGPPSARNVCKRHMSSPETHNARSDNLTLLSVPGYTAATPEITVSCDDDSLLNRLSSLNHYGSHHQASPSSLSQHERSPPLYQLPPRPHSAAQIGSVDRTQPSAFTPLSPQRHGAFRPLSPQRSLQLTMSPSSSLIRTPSPNSLMDYTPNDCSAASSPASSQTAFNFFGKHQGMSTQTSSQGLQLPTHAGPSLFPDSALSSGDNTDAQRKAIEWWLLRQRILSQQLWAQQQQKGSNNVLPSTANINTPHLSSNVVVGHHSMIGPVGLFDAVSHQQHRQARIHFTSNAPYPNFKGQRSRSESDIAYVCSYCGQSFALHDRLAKHIASRHRDRTAVGGSTQGGKGSGADSPMKAHKCQICGKCFGRSDMLTRHMRLHTGVKPYACQVCGQVFSRSDHLSTHQRTHTGEKPYQCPQCPYAASRRDMITRHLKTHLKGVNQRLQSEGLARTNSGGPLMTGQSNPIVVAPQRHFSAAESISISRAQMSYAALGQQHMIRSGGEATTLIPDDATIELLSNRLQSATSDCADDDKLTPLTTD